MPSKKSTKQAENSDLKMKVIVLVALIAAFIGGYLVARAKYKPQIIELSNMVTDKDAALQQMKSISNRIMMRDDKVWVVENGTERAMDSDIVMQNGAKVMMDGKVSQSDGSEVIMKNGDAINMSGTMMSTSGN